MDEFFTPETYTAIANAEIEAERYYYAMIDSYDPYSYDEAPEEWRCYDCQKSDCGCDFCHEETCECPDEQGNEDLGWEEGLFGWE